MFMMAVMMMTKIITMITMITMMTTTTMMAMMTMVECFLKTHLNRIWDRSSSSSLKDFHSFWRNCKIFIKNLIFINIFCSSHDQFQSHRWCLNQYLQNWTSIQKDGNVVLLIDRWVFWDFEIESSIFWHWIIFTIEFELVDLCHN